MEPNSDGLQPTSHGLHLLEVYFPRRSDSSHLRNPPRAGAAQEEAVAMKRLLEDAPDDFDEDIDGVDKMITYEFIISSAGAQKAHDPVRSARRAQLRRITEPILRERIQPFVWARYPKAGAVCHSMIRRYLERERRTHDTHWDIPSYVSVVVSLDSSGQDFEGGFFVTTGNGEKSFIPLQRGDTVVHQSDLLHGVHVRHGERWSWAMWFQDSWDCSSRAESWWQQEAEARDPVAQTLRAMRAATQQESYSWLQEAAQAGFPRAQLYFGKALEDGLAHHAPDPPAAAAWFERSRLGGEIDACASAEIVVEAGLEGHVPSVQTIRPQIYRKQVPPTIKEIECSPSRQRSAPALMGRPVVPRMEEATSRTEMPVRRLQLGSAKNGVDVDATWRPTVDETMSVGGLGAFFWDETRRERAHDQGPCELELGAPGTGLRQVIAMVSPGSSESSSMADDQRNRPGRSTMDAFPVRGFGAVGQGVQVHRRPVRSVNFAPDGQRLCTASEDGTAKVFDLSTGKLLKEVDHHNTIWWADFSQDGQMLVTCSDDRSVRVYDCSRWELLEMFGHGLPVKSASFSGERLATASGDGFLRVFDLDSGRELAKHKHESWVISCRFAHDGTFLASGAADKWLRVFDEEGELVFKHCFAGLVTCVDFSKEALLCATTTRQEDGIYVLDVPSGRRVQLIQQKAIALSARFSPDGEQIHCVSRHGVQVYEVSSGQLLENYPHDVHVNYVSMRSDGLLCSCADDGRLRFFGTAAAAPALEPMN
ncbi:unnamed protein product [Durusdinium trenchii]|uniref:Fe2OG dioxygenase domain-containing protein n=1 Tax=Durusdinium trenchii TaxID=1381693 RepID=A0ABP0N3W7_9DINO